MNGILSNNIVSNPKGWAQKVVGSSRRYRLMQAVTLVFGGALGWILYLICTEAQLPLFGYLIVLGCVLVAVVQLPLCYLRALRSYVIDAN
ncbi:MAG: hypothetical protein IH623_16580 [Verrucomicrobia bacterium]|nr:hypothetical protein [Verrucomicrobiota bacterium]